MGIDIVAKFEKVSKEQFISDIGTSFNCGLQAYENIKLPQRGTKESAGYDIRSPFSFTLKPGESIVVPTGLRCNIKSGWFLIGVPRSGSGFKYRVMLYNTVGIIDGDYYYADNEGHIKFKLINANHEGKVFEVNVGDAICQGIFIPYGITVDDSVDQVRTGGFGSTGK